MSTVIIGAGIIGVSTAYYLSESTNTAASSIHLVESSTRLFASASGYAAGFLAKDWFSQATAPLGALSFDLHKDLAEKYNGREKWGYSKSTATSLTAVSAASRGDDWLNEGGSRTQAAGEHEQRIGDAPLWLTPQKDKEVEVISDGGTTAQVDPLRLSQFLLDECIKRGVQLHQPAKATSVSKDIRDELAGVRIESADGQETDLPCTRLVITAGAWTHQVFDELFPHANIRIPVTSLTGHSLVVRSPRWSTAHEERGCHAVFATDPSGFSPELFSRIGGEIYIAGLNSTDIPLPKIATEAKIDEAAIETLQAVSTRLLGVPNVESDLEIVRQGLCYRPVTPNGRPFLAKVPDQKLGDGMSTRAPGGIFISAGHGPWGISLSLGTGKVLAELIDGKEPSIGLTPFRI